MSALNPLLAAVDSAFTQRAARATSGDRRNDDRLANVIDALTSMLTGHLGHEERDGLPLISAALTVRERRSVGGKIARKGGLAGGAEMFAWILDGADADPRTATLGQLPRRCACSTALSGNPASRKPRW
jgi:hypothetical protein